MAPVPRDRHLAAGRDPGDGGGRQASDLGEQGAPAQHDPGREEAGDHGVVHARRQFGQQPGTVRDEVRAVDHRVIERRDAQMIGPQHQFAGLVEPEIALVLARGRA